MRVWIDFANSPHVPLLEPVARRLEDDGHEVLLTARDHAQTVELARARRPGVIVVGAQSPRGRAAKGRSIALRTAQLWRFARRARPDVALSHGSYAQLLAAWAARLPGVTMMDYEHQPANHLSFRLVRRVIVPQAFPEEALRRYGADPEKVIRYPGFKEELYLAGFQPDSSVLDGLGLEPSRVIAVFRPPPEGALYHPMANERFEELLRLALADDEVDVVLLPRDAEQRQRYTGLSERIRVPARAIDGASLLALADVVVGAGGTMNRESALMGTPTYTVFAGPLAAVDADLIRAGRLHDLREAALPRFEKKPADGSHSPAAAEPIMAAVLEALADVRDSRRRPRRGRRHG
jgi:predicted glycosyltransferase